jgi:predicted ATP-grasp superfamily ATP-dependent carboligase
MRVPEFTFVTDSEGLRAAIEKYDYPEKTVIIKPCRGRGGRGLHVLCGGDNPPTWLGRGKRETRVGGQDLNGDRLAGLVQEASLVMPCLRAPAYDADVVFVGGGRYSIILRKRVNPAGIPFEGNRIIPDAKVLAYCREVAVCLGLRAMHDIDLMTNSDGDAVVLEVNPRPSGSLAASLAAGFPLIDWAVSAVLGFEVEIAEPKKEIEVRAVPCALAITV